MNELKGRSLGKSSIRPLFFLWLWLMFLTGAHVSAAILVGGCGPGTAGRSGASMAIPGDPQGRKGWIDGKAQTDDAGNKHEVWCIEIPGGVGNSFGVRFIPVGGNPKWLGRCAFVGGVNTDSKEPGKDANKNGKPDKWTKITWTSEDDGGGGAADPKDDDKTAGKKDFDWEYNIATNTLKRWETKDGKRLRVDPDFNGPPPENFDNLFAAAPPPNQNQADEMLAAAVVSVSLATQVGGVWNYLLSGNNLTEFSPTSVFNGDSWSIAVLGVTDAVAPPGWSVDFTNDYATWTYLSGIPLNLSLNPVSGFILTSLAPAGTAFWLSDGTDDELANFGYAGTVVGPARIPEPSTLMLFAVGAFGLLGRRHLALLLFGPTTKVRQRLEADPIFRPRSHSQSLHSRGV